MREFNYLGKVDATSNGDADYEEHDLEGLEREIEHVIRCGTAGAAAAVNLDSKIVNLDTNGQHMAERKTRTAATKKRRNIPSYGGALGVAPKKVGTAVPSQMSQQKQDNVYM